ncbi:hypothetical protein [Pedobacter hartonius]|uniref:Uncharacterized protein n=1 Tax=Pedobacter hartonius TaxID=425514 RepID=A0A1H3ZXS0_9SPHI|nr:hypothetical protein [Pedobacter hartonius]SEA28104.1 hypothetical protein SAMN05443550_102519 [Pedobacter hartonius]
MKTRNYVGFMGYSGGYIGGYHFIHYIPERKDHLATGTWRNGNDCFFRFWKIRGTVIHR